MEQVSVSPSAQALVFIRELEREIMACEAVRHPFLARFGSEPLTIEQIRAFGLQHYQLVKVFTTYMTNVLPKIPDRDAATLFRHVFDDELGAGSGRGAAVDPRGRHAVVEGAHLVLGRVDARGLRRATGLHSEGIRTTRWAPNP